MKKLIFLIALPLLAQKHVLVSGLTNTNLAPTPPMGWNSFIPLGTAANETTVKASCLAMTMNGLLVAGYNYCNLDDGWMNFTEGASNAPTTPTPRPTPLIPDPGKFPSGMASLGTYIHGLAMKFGIYLSAGLSTCGGGGCDTNHCYWTYGSAGYEFSDAASIALWGADYLKYDSTCWMPFTSPQLAAGAMYQAHVKMAKALRSTGRTIMFTGGPGGSDNCAQWFASAGVSSSRIGDDMNPQTWAQMSTLGFGDNLLIHQYGGPNAWLDLDFLIVGNGLTDTEGLTQMSLWSLQAAPLILGVDVRSGAITTNSLATLENSTVITVDQDPLGYIGTQVSTISCGSATCQVWAKKLTGTNKWAIGLFNLASTSQTVSTTWSAITTAIPAFANMSYGTNKDLWANWPTCTAGDCSGSLGTLASGYSTTVASHGVSFITVAP